MYKIKVSEYGRDDYKVSLYKKGWLFWNLVETDVVLHRSGGIKFTEAVISRQIRKWQDEFNVPDERVFIQS